MPFINIAFIFVLFIVVYQDFRFRTISFWIIPVLWLIVFAINIEATEFKTLAFNTAINLLVFAFEIILLYVYYALKYRKFTSIINEYIGVGDILYITVLCMLFSPIVFNVVLIMGLWLTLIGYAVSKLFFKENYTIPLAGSLSVFLIISWTIKMLANIEQIYTIDILEKIVAL